MLNSVVNLNRLNNLQNNLAKLRDMQSCQRDSVVTMRFHGWKFVTRQTKALARCCLYLSEHSTTSPHERFLKPNSVINRSSVVFIILKHPNRLKFFLIFLCLSFPSFDCTYLAIVSQQSVQIPRCSKVRKHGLFHRFRRYRDSVSRLYVTRQ